MISLFRQARPAHHQAFLATDGDDPEWPLWYAEFLHQQVSQVLGIPLTRSELVAWLVQADKDHRRNQPESDWAQHYADLFLGYASD